MPIWLHGHRPSHFDIPRARAHLAGDARARGSLRFSLGYSSTQHDVDCVGAVIREVVERARRATCPR